MMRLPILLVDDNPDACAMSAKLLWAWGYQADVAYNAATALQLAEQKPYALAIVDYRLPDMDGVELFRHMRELRSDLAGILLTGYSSSDVVDPAMQAGILRILTKPVDFKELMPIIQEFVGAPT